MARFPDEIIHRLKKEVPLKDLVEAKGIKLKRQGKDWAGLCPFHSEKTPSFLVTPSKNLFHCMGCGEGGSVIDFVMKINRISFREAAEALIRDHLPHAAAAVVPEKETPLDLAASDDDQVLLQRVVADYHHTLKQCPEAMAYLKKRGLVHGQVIEKFKLGYANRSLRGRLPNDGTASTRLRDLGIFRATGHEHFNRCLVVPVFGPGGRILELYGRRIEAVQRRDTPQHLYLPGPHSGVWNEEGLAAGGTVILCEALIDALTFWVNGLVNVTASYGTRGFTDAHLAVFLGHGVQRVLIAYDRDKAGDEAALVVAQKLLGEGIQPLRIQFPKGMDANDFALAVKPARKSLETLIVGAVPIGTLVRPANPESSRRERGRGEKVHRESPKPAESAPPAVPPIPSVPLVDVRTEVRGDHIYLAFAERNYRVSHLEQNLGKNVLKVNLLAYRGPECFADTLNLYSAYHRHGYAKRAALEIGADERTVDKDLGHMLLKLEALRDEHIAKTLDAGPKPVPMTPAEKEEALALLTDEKLLVRILEDFDRCGMVGEETNKLTGYLVAISRKLDRPLGALIQSTSAAGKSATMDAVLAFVPEEDQVKYSAMTGQALYYKGETDLQHKVLALVEEEGAEKASYPLKLLLSEGELRIASTGKSTASGEHATRDYIVKGPVAVFLSTTSVETDEEFQNRCLVLAVDESRAQTREIHRRQRHASTLQGLQVNKAREFVVRRQQNAQRLLRPLKVVNPYAERLTFRDDKTRMRRDHLKYLNLIACITYLHQYQRPIKHLHLDNQPVAYIEVALADIVAANRIAHEVLGRCLDELPPQSRRLLGHLHDLVTHIAGKENQEPGAVRFTRRQVREATGWSEFQVRTHLNKLLALEYVIAHRGSHGQTFVYELSYDGQGQDGTPFLSGLIDADQLHKNGNFEHAQPHFEHLKTHNEHASSPQRAPNEIDEKGHKPNQINGVKVSFEPHPEITRVQGGSTAVPRQQTHG